MNLGKTALCLALLCLASVASAAEVMKDIPYYPKDWQGSGDAAYRDARCKLDVCVPDHEAGEKLPVVVWFHGGGLSGGQKHIIDDFTKHKILVVAVNYRLMPKAKAPDFIEDAAAAVAWTFANAEKYGGDPARIYVAGHSAGGYLSMMIGMNPKYLERHQLKNTDIAALFPISGQATTHFAIVGAAQAEQGQERPANFKRDNPITLDEYAPLKYTDQRLPPIHLLCGDPQLEWPARVEENALMAAMIRTVTGHNVIELRSFPGTNHGSCVEPSVEYICRVIGGGR
jgi:acetyl esterase/lipase